MLAIFGRFSQNCQAVLVKAQELSSQLNRPIQTDLVLLSILSFANFPVNNLIKETGLTYDKLLAALETIPEEQRLQINQKASAEMQIFLEESIKMAARFRFNLVEIDLLVLNICENRNYSANKILQKLKINTTLLTSRLKELLFSFSMLNEGVPSVGGGPVPERDRGGENMERFVVNLSEKAAEGKLDPVIGRENELNQLIHILLRRRKNNPLLLGEPGVGKTALVDGLAQRIHQKKVPAALIDKQILTLDLSLVVAGTMYRGQFEERLKGILQEVQNFGNGIIFIDEIHTLTGAGGSEGGFDAANILKPALAKGEISIIGATTFEEYRKHIWKDKALDRRFQVVNIEEPSIKESISMLKGLKKDLERHHNVIITDEALRAAVELSARYIHDRFLPDKAIDVIDQASTLHAAAYVENKELVAVEDELGYISNQKTELILDSACTDESDWKIAKALAEREVYLIKQLETLRKAQSKQKADKPTVSLTQVILTISEKTGIPTKDLEQTLKPLNIAQIRSTLADNILGQENALKTIAQSLIRAQLGLNPAKKPIGSFLLVGPTGVGKTETARILAKEIFGDTKALIKIDMSEYMERHNVSNLIGAPAGYIGFDQGGGLTEQVRRRPYAVVLFDEVEKAHPDVFHLLLQILEDGQLTDNTGQSVSFEHTLVIMTSNIGMESFNQAAKIGFEFEEGSEVSEAKHKEELNAHIKEEIEDFFRPELLGRLSSVIYYQPLSPDVVKTLVTRRFNEFKKLMKSKGITLTLKADFINKFVNNYDPEAGARSIDRLFLKELEPVVIQHLLDYPDESKIELGYDKDQIISKTVKK